MIAVVEVEISARDPEAPLWPCKSYVGSPSSFRFRNVPKRVGNWNINSVQVEVTYPDGQIASAECVLTGGIWVGTVAGTATPGKSAFGYSVYASGTDENNNPVTGYCLGKGDVEVLDDQGQITPGGHVVYTTLLSAAPDLPKEGNIWESNGSFYVYLNGAVQMIGDDSGAIATLSAVVENKRDITDFNVYVRPNSTTTIYVGPSPCEWNESSQRWESPYGDAYVMPPETPQSNTYYVFVGGMGDEVELAPPQYKGVFHGDYTDLPVSCSPSDTIAKTSQVPTKTSDLTNNSGFITLAQVPTPNEIRDNNGNAIRANREVNYVGEVDKWTVNIDSQDYVFTGEKGDAAYAPENPQSGDVKYTLSWSAGDTMWFLKYYDWINGDWEQTDSFSSYDDYESTFLEFNGGEGQTASWGQVVESDELALKSDVPTKTSDLVNDSGFITVGQVPTPDKIADTYNVINADRSVSVDVVSYYWRFYDGNENEYDFTGTKTNSEWTNGTDKMTLVMPDSSHWTLQRYFNLAGAWISQWSEMIEGTEEDNSIVFHEQGYSGSWIGTHAQTSDELALKSYVDSQIGQVLTEAV